MMRRMIPVLLLLCLLLCSCQASDPIAPMASTATDLYIPAPDAAEALPREDMATLWFRFGSEPLLAQEQRVLTLSPTAPYELTLLQALAAGPAAASTELSGLFPPGTKVLSTHRQGRTLFVTLSRQIMNDFPDEPADWAANPAFSAETPLRRQLAMQAIAATVTENCDIDQVVILVEQTSQGSDSLRLRQRYYRTPGMSEDLAAPLMRDESMLLTAHQTLALILDCCAEQNLPRLYPFIARKDPANGKDRPTYETFCAQMDTLPRLSDWEASAGSVSADGQSAVFNVRLTLLDGGQVREHRCVIRLHRERDLWRIGLSQLTEREVSAP